MERRLAAILAADVVNYSRLIGADEEGTLSTLKSHRSYIDDRVKRHGGKVFGSAGDSLVAEFTSPVEAVRCAVEIQQELKRRNANLPDDGRMLFRIGVNLGDVVAEDGNLLGDGVNVAARLEAEAPPGGICISRQVAEQMAGKVDIIFADAGERLMKNIAKPVQVWIWPPELAKKKMRRSSKIWSAATAIVGLAAITLAVIYFAFDSKDTPKLPTGPRIAIIPFENVGVDPEDAYFSEGLTRDLNAQLARFSNLFVLAPEAGEAYRDDPDCKTIRNELKADYILTGTVRRAANKLRVTTSFLDAETCLQLTPPGPFDRDLNLENILDIQLEISRKVAAQIGSSDAPLISANVQRTIRDKAPEKLDAYECVLLGYWFYQTFALPEHRKARKCLERAVVDEPGYSLAWSRLAFIYLESKKRGHDTPPNWAQLANDAAKKAFSADRDNPDAYYAMAVRSRMLGEDLDVFRPLAQRAIELNPNDSWILADLGIFLAYSGEWEEGKEWITRARALNPKLHVGYTNAWVLHAFVQGNYDQARNHLLNMPKHGPMSWVTLTASYALNDEQQLAEKSLAHIRENWPDFLDDPLAPFRARGMPQYLIDKLGEGLELAGHKLSSQ